MNFAGHTPRWLGRHAPAAIDVRNCLVAGLLVMATVPVSATDFAVQVQETGGVYHVHGAFTVAVPVSAAWRVLGDYEHIGEFVKSVRGSKFVTAADGSRVLQQDAVTGVFPFRRSIRVHLSVHEHSNSRIEFRDVLGRDFLQYAGAWTLKADSVGTNVSYDLEAQPRKNVPGFVGRGVMARSARDFLKQVRAEMLHRADIVRTATESAASR